MQMCMILRFKVSLIHRDCGKPDPINSTLLPPKTIPSLVQAFKILPFVVSAVAKIRPYPSKHGRMLSRGECSPRVMLKKQRKCLPLVCNFADK